MGSGLALRAIRNDSARISERGAHTPTRPALAALAPATLPTRGREGASLLASRIHPTPDLRSDPPPPGEVRRDLVAASPAPSADRGSGLALRKDNGAAHFP